METKQARLFRVARFGSFFALECVVTSGVTSGRLFRFKSKTGKEITKWSETCMYVIYAPRKKIGVCLVSLAGVCNCKRAVAADENSFTGTAAAWATTESAKQRLTRSNG